MFAKLICVEGPDMHCKATQSKMLTERLTSRGFQSIRIEVPVNDHVTYPLIYWMLKNGSAKRFPYLFQLVQFMNKFVFQWTTLLWVMMTHDYVVLDRWSLSSIVYGEATGVNQMFVRLLSKLLYKPDLTLVMHGKSYHRDGQDSYEADSDLQKTVKQIYYEHVLDNLSDHALVNNTRTREEQHDDVMKHLVRNGLTY